jgi:acetyl esterase/lipase
MQAIVNIYGPTDMAALYRDTLLAVRPCVRRYLGGRPDEQPDRYREASPVSHVRADAPPVLTLHGECDSVVPVSQGQALHDALTAAGAKSTLIRVARGRHAWCDDFAGLDSQRTLPAIIQFLSDTLGPGARPHPES